MLRRREWRLRLVDRPRRLELASALTGSLFVQAVMVPLLVNDMNGADQEVLDLRAPLVVIAVLGIVTTQVVMVCGWRLLTMVRGGTVFSRAGSAEQPW